MLQSLNTDSDKSPIDLYLEQQQELTPVERFSEQHARQTTPDQETYYKELIPANRPRPGEQYAFKVNLDKCSGCKACVTACHSLNGLEEEETWRDVGLIHSGTQESAFQQTVTTACHHCVDPGCLNGCPVLAYEKDEATGIVVHLDDQCIGCQYCVLKCPYDVPKYSKNLGIVRKCDMCHDRLGEGEAPACVQACPTEAIEIAIIHQDDAVAEGEADSFLPGTPDANITKPTTRYVTERELPDDLIASDRFELKPQHAHWPLVLMLTLTQVGVGGFLAAFVGSFLSSAAGYLPITTVLAAIAMHAGLAASVFHLGKPLKAWRVFLGLKKSWLSREAVVFGGLAGAGTLYTALAVAAYFFPEQSIAPWLFKQSLIGLFGFGTIASGLLGVFCSAMIYHDTQRDFWKISRSALKFGGTTLIGMLAIATLGVSLVNEGTSHTLLSILTMIAVTSKLLWEAAFLKHKNADDFTPDKQSALTITKKLNQAFVLRNAFSGAGILFCALAILTGGGLSISMSALAAIGFLCGEFSERYLYFRAVTAPKMPGFVQ